MSNNQARVLEYNARYLGLSYTEEQLLYRLPFIDILPEECSNVVADILEYMRRPSDDHTGRETIRGRIYDLIQRYKDELKTIE